MEYLRVNKGIKVRMSDILYIRKVRESEALGMDRDGCIQAARHAAIIVMRKKSAKRIVMPVAFETLLERTAFVDIGDNRYVPASSIESIEQSADEGEGKRFCSVWLFGGALLTSVIPFYILDSRRKDGAFNQQRIDERAHASERVKNKLMSRTKCSPIIPPYPFPFPESGFGVAA